MKDYVLTLLVTAAVTYMLTPLVRRLAGRMGAMKEPRDRDVHVAPVPLLGGVAMYGGLVAGLVVADHIPQLKGALANTGMITGLLLAGGLLVVVGIIDDRWGMSPLTKAAGQVAAGGILVATGTQLNWLPLPGGTTFFPTSDQATVLTILIVVATINAVNFIDGLDGLAAGIVAIAAISFFLYYYSMTTVIDYSKLAAPALASAILIGMCLGFLPHNFSPASIFMGDTGSMLLGLLLAYAPISSITSLDPALLTHSVNRYPEILPLLLPAALLVIPYADLLLAVVRRTRAGQSPFAPDRKHLHHRLLDIGHSQRASVLIMYLWATLFSGSVVWLSLQRTQQPGAANHHGHPVFVFIAITVTAVVALLLMSMPKLRWLRRSARLDAPPAEQEAELEESGSKLAGVTAPAAIAAAVREPVPAAAAELRPPAAAPVAARGSAEPQLVAAAAVARMTPLDASMPYGDSPGRLTPTPDWVADRERVQGERSERAGTARDWADPDWAAPDWAAPDWASQEWSRPDGAGSDWAGRHQAESGWPGRSDGAAADQPGPVPGTQASARGSGDSARDAAPLASRRAMPAPGHVPSASDASGTAPSASAWRFGDRRRSDREPSARRPADQASAEAAPAEVPRRSSTYFRSPGAPANGASAARNGGSPADGSSGPADGGPAYLPVHGAPAIPGDPADLGPANGGPASGGPASRTSNSPEASPAPRADTGGAAVRSIIGTPPPAITSLGANGTPGTDSQDVERRETGPAES